MIHRKMGVTIADLREKGVEVVAVPGMNLFIRNLYKEGITSGGEKVLVENVFQTESRSRKGVNKALGINSEKAFFPCNWGEIVTLPGGKAIVGSSQILDMLAMDRSAKPTEAEVEGAKRVLKSKLGFKEVVVIGTFGEERHASMFDIDLVVTPVGENKVVFSDLFCASGVDEVEKTTLEGQHQKMRDDLVSAGVEIVGSVPFIAARHPQDGLTIVSYNNCLVSGEKVYVPQYVGEGSEGFGESNKDAMAAWQEIAQKNHQEVVPIRVATGNCFDLRGSLRCMTVEIDK